jgi:hypothetical protein
MCLPGKKTVSILVTHREEIERGRARGILDITSRAVDSWPGMLWGQKGGHSSATSPCCSHMTLFDGVQINLEFGPKPIPPLPKMLWYCYRVA